MAPADGVAFQVRVNGKLAEEIGSSRLSVQLQKSPIFIGDILDAMKKEYPDSSVTIQEAIPFVSGNHRGIGDEVVPGQEVTLLMPAAGG